MDTFIPVATSEPPVTRHAYVRVLHGEKCKDREKGSDWQHCRCRKWIFKYDSSQGTQTIKYSAKTRDWGEAQKQAQDWLDSFDSDKVRIKALEAEQQRLKAEKEAQAVTIEEAIGRFIGSLILNKLENTTINSFRGLLGYISPNTFEVRRPGSLLKWLNDQNPRPVFVSDLTPKHVEAFRLSWTWNDRTSNTYFKRLKQFFQYCVVHKWINENPMEHSKRPEVRQGNRTGAFSDEQWLKIEATAEAAVANATDLQERQDAERLLAFVELLRWSGMALHDATVFSFNDAPRCFVDSNGALTYIRRKTKKHNRSAITKLPPHVIQLLRNMPIGRGSDLQPFLEAGRTGQTMKIHSVKQIWWLRLVELYKNAEIGKIKTDIGVFKNPGAHTLRDTFAVGIICSGINDATAVAAKALGDTMTVVENHYSPWIEKMKSQQAAKSNQAIEAQMAQLEALKQQKKQKLTPVAVIGGRRG